MVNRQGMQQNKTTTKENATMMRVFKTTVALLILVMVLAGIVQAHSVTFTGGVNSPVWGGRSYKIKARFLDDSNGPVTHWEGFSFTTNSGTVTADYSETDDNGEVAATWTPDASGVMESTTDTDYVRAVNTTHTPQVYGELTAYIARGSFSSTIAFNWALCTSNLPTTYGVTNNWTWYNAPGVEVLAGPTYKYWGNRTGNTTAVVRDADVNHLDYTTQNQTNRLETKCRASSIYGNLTSQNYLTITWVPYHFDGNTPHDSLKPKDIHIDIGGKVVRCDAGTGHAWYGDAYPYTNASVQHYAELDLFGGTDLDYYHRSEFNGSKYWSGGYQTTGSTTESGITIGQWYYYDFDADAYTFTNQGFATTLLLGTVPSYSAGATNANVGGSPSAEVAYTAGVTNVEKIW